MSEKSRTVYSHQGKESDKNSGDLIKAHDKLWSSSSVLGNFLKIHALIVTARPSIPRNI